MNYWRDSNDYCINQNTVINLLEVQLADLPLTFVTWRKLILFTWVCMCTGTVKSLHQYFRYYAFFSCLKYINKDQISKASLLLCSSFPITMPRVRFSELLETEFFWKYFRYMETKVFCKASNSCCLLKLLTVKLTTSSQSKNLHFLFL